MKERVLLVDDEDNLLSAVKRQLRGQFDIHSAHSPHVAIQMLEKDPSYSVIVSDMRMPGMNGIEFLQAAQKISPNSIRIMLTGNSDQNTASNAINESHVYKFLTKPCSTETIEKALTDAVFQFHISQVERELLDKTLQGSIQLLTDILSLTAPDLFHQATEAQHLCECLAKKICPEETLNLKLAALFSDISAIAVPKDLFVKVREGSALTKDESHALFYSIDLSRSLLANIPKLEEVSQIVFYQYKNFDGTGEPSDSKHNSAPLASQVLRICKDYFYLRTKNLSVAECFKILVSRKGIYNPKVLQVFGSEILNFNNERSKTITKKKVTSSELNSNQTLIEDIRTNTGLLLLAAGTKLSEISILRIQNHSRVNQIPKLIYIEEETTENHETQY